MPEITVNLNKAQKLLDRLKTVINNYNLSDRSKVGFGVQPVKNFVAVQYSHQGAEKMAQELNEEVRKQKEYYREYMCLLHDLTNVRDALFAGNVTSGVSKTLNQIDDLKKIHALRELLKKDVSANTTGYSSSFITDENLPEYYNTQCERHRTLAVSSEFTVRRELYTQEQIDFDIRHCNQLIDSLEDTRDRLNHTTMITLDISDTAQKVLGLKA